MSLFDEPICGGIVPIIAGLTQWCVSIWFVVIQPDSFAALWADDGFRIPTGFAQQHPTKLFQFWEWMFSAANVAYAFLFQSNASKIKIARSETCSELHLYNMQFKKENLAVRANDNNNSKNNPLECRRILCYHDSIRIGEWICSGIINGTYIRIKPTCFARKAPPTGHTASNFTAQILPQKVQILMEIFLLLNN